MRGQSFVNHNLQLIAFYLNFAAFSCTDFNEDNFDWYDDAERPTNLANLRIHDDGSRLYHYSRCFEKTGSEADAAMATKPNAAKKFSADLPAEKLIPYLLESKYYTADVKSSVKVTYVFDADRYSVVSGLTSIRIVT